MAFPGYAAPSAFVLDAGVIKVGNTIVGATRGGMTFTEGKEVRHVEFDGKTTDIAGLHRITMYETTISGDMLDCTDASIGRYFPGASSDGSSDNLWTMKEAREMFTSNDYLQNLTWVGQSSQASTETLVITFPYAFVTEASFRTNDKDEGIWSITFKAVLAPNATNLEAAPFTITNAAA